MASNILIVTTTTMAFLLYFARILARMVKNADQSDKQNAGKTTNPWTKSTRRLSTPKNSEQCLGCNPTELILSNLLSCFLSTDLFAT